MKTTRDILRTSVALFIYAGVLVGMTKPWLLAIVVVLIVARLRAKKPAQLWSHGTARWADVNDLRRAGLLDAKEGLIIGRVEI